MPNLNCIVVPEILTCVILAKLDHAMPCHACRLLVLNMLCYACAQPTLWHQVGDLLDLLLVGAAVNGPGRPLVIQPVGNLVKALFQAVPVASQPSQHSIKVLTGCFHLHFPVVQITQSSPGPECMSISCCCTAGLIQTVWPTKLQTSGLEQGIHSLMQWLSLQGCKPVNMSCEHVMRWSNKIDR